MRVLGIDPGYDRLGVAVLEKKEGKEHLLFSKCILTNRSDLFEVRLHAIGSALKKILATWQPDMVAIETLYMSKNQKTALPVASARGVILYIATEHGVPIREYSPQAIKIATTGYGNSTKEQVTRMIPRLVTMPNKKALDDEFDAIAAALTALATERSVPTPVIHSES